jgi:hypothetical protein
MQSVEIASLQMLLLCAAPQVLFLLKHITEVWVMPDIA